MTGYFLLRLLVCCLLSLLTLTSYATTQHTPKITIIIDDLGDSRNAGLRAVNLPGAVVCSIMPYSFYSTTLAKMAHHAGKEVMLHIPMQAIKPHELGQGGLYRDMSQQEFLETLDQDLQAVPYVQGVNNHMGSRLTMLPVPMTLLMQTLKSQGLFFVDSKTTPSSIAEDIAHAERVPSLHRDIFLDEVLTTEAIQEQFNELLVLARRNGYAVAIGHPHAITLDFLERVLPRLSEQGFQLVPASELLATQPRLKSKLVAQRKSKILSNSICEIYPRFCEWMGKQLN